MKSAREPDVRQRDDLRLRQRQRLITTSAGSTTKALAYDGVGRVWSSGVPGQATRFLYDGQEVIAEYNVSGTLLRRYVHGPGVDEPLVWYEISGGSPQRSHLYADRQGSIVATAGDSGALTGINAYDEYGLPNGALAERFGYTGQKFLSEIGLYDYKARIYSPTLGRFLQPDPTGYGPGMNLYAYTNGSPTNATDPSGQACVYAILDGYNTGPSSDCYTNIYLNFFDEGAGGGGGVFSNLSGGGGGGISTPLPASMPQNTQRRCAGGSKVLDALGKINAAGNSAVGLEVGALGYAAGKLLGTDPIISFGNNALIFQNSPLEVSGRALTLGNVSIYPSGTGPGSVIRSAYTSSTVVQGTHEEGHTLQAQILGPLYGPAAALGALIFGDKSPLEVGADNYATGQSCVPF